MFWMTLLLTLTPAWGVQDDDLRKEVEKLKKQTAELQEKITLLEQSSLEDAQTIQRLRQALKVLEANLPGTEPQPANPKNTDPTIKPKFNGPAETIRGKVVYVDAKMNFLALSVGKKEKVQLGYKFEIYRETYENGGESRLIRLGMGEVEKFMGGQDSMAKIVISEGNIAEMKADDLAVAIRKITDAPPTSGEGRAVPAPAAPPADPNKEGVYTITGKVGAGFVLNFGTVLGARQTQLLFVYRDGKFKAKLRLDKVEKAHSVGFVVDGTMELPPEQGDQVYTKELNKVLAGKVALSDDKNGRLAVDLRQRDGVKPGMTCEVRRLGQKVGTILITEVQNWGSWAKPQGDLRIDQIQKGDFVEVIEEK
jgi:hypothetical protein